jgi:hypothetical protein
MLSDSRFSQLIQAIQGSPWDLQHLSWLSQILLLVVAVGAAFVAFHQVSATKLFELLEFVEQEEFRDARRVVHFEIDREFANKQWWADDQHDDWEKAAAKVCAFFDILGLIVKRSLFARIHIGAESFFTREWSSSIIKARKALQPYLAYRRETEPSAYHGFTWLYCRARRAHAKVREGASSDGRTAPRPGEPVVQKDQTTGK